MIQVIVSGQVKALNEYKPGGGGLLGYQAEVHEKVWDGEKQVVRIWIVHLDVYTGKKLEKAMVQIKYFGFICNDLTITYELQGTEKRLVVWYNLNGKSFFTL